MPRTIERMFFDHPRSVDESYFQHMWFAARFAASLFVAGAAAMVHALVPCVCERTASRMVRDLHGRVDNRG